MCIKLAVDIIREPCHTNLVYSFRLQNNDSSVKNQNGFSHTSPMNLLKSSDFH